jgi:hypothetical protein
MQVVKRLQAPEEQHGSEAERSRLPLLWHERVHRDAAQQWLREHIANSV